tara:strand:- start:67 stop:312 length:246 start_codon:yes stop_codon:yes gene_type:complete
MAYRKKVTPEHPEGQVIEFTAAEEAQLVKDKASHQAVQDALKAERDQKASDQANGNTKLLGLGLTQAEATALTGYTPPVEE